jgi:hypothetical protein
MIWSVLPWRRCKASLEPNHTPYWGRCERLKKHEGYHALERGFDVVWFVTQIVDIKQEWADVNYAKADAEASVLMMEELPYGPPVRPQRIVEWERSARDPEHDRLWGVPDEDRPPPGNGRYYSRKDDERDAAWLARNPNED